MCTQCNYPILVSGVDKKPVTLPILKSKDNSFVVDDWVKDSTFIVFIVKLGPEELIRELLDVILSENNEMPFVKIIIYCNGCLISNEVSVDPKSRSVSLIPLCKDRVQCDKSVEAQAIGFGIDMLK